MTIGSSRLISASQGLNVKRSFDGVVAAVRTGAWIVEGGVARLVGVDSGAFDDVAASGQQFWGAIGGAPELPVQGRHRRRLLSGCRSQSSPSMRRASDANSGTPSASSSPACGRPSISTTTSSASGATFAGAGVMRLGGRGGEFRARHARGRGVRASRCASIPPPAIAIRSTRACSRSIRCFPGNSYSGAVGLLGPTNLTDVTARGASSRAARGSPSFSRCRRTSGPARDAIYNIELRPLINIASSRERYVGRIPAWSRSGPATPHLTLTGVITRFLPGGYTAAVLRPARIRLLFVVHHLPLLRNAGVPMSPSPR